MTKEESKSLVEYIRSLYPGQRITEGELKKTIDSFANEFSEVSCKKVLDAFYVAKEEYPGIMPSAPMLQKAMRTIDSRIGFKSEEQEFIDTHCGKTREEWARMVAWEKSPEGSAKIVEYKKRLAQIISTIGGKNEQRNSLQDD